MQNSASRSLAAWMMARPSVALATGRVDAIDLARGIAVSLMILNHGVKGLLPFEAFPSWGLVPVHAATRFSSTLFILVFGIALAVVFLPHVNTPEWPRRRLKLLMTGVLILFWYKVLTVVEMFQHHEPGVIVDTLLYGNFPSFVEILGFYAIALIWMPFFLSGWARMAGWMRLACPVIIAVLAELLARYFDFLGSTSLRALLVEHPDAYTWGQLSRGPVIMVGLLIGEAMMVMGTDRAARWRLARWLAWAAIALGAGFLALGLPDLPGNLLAIAYNEGKHPPTLIFMLYSAAGALAILALAVAGGHTLARILSPLTTIGRDALGAFIFHISVIFVVFRYLLGYWHDIGYGQALALTLFLLLGTALWIRITRFFRHGT